MAHRRFTKQREFNKKVFALKFSIIILIGIILGVSCLFSKTIETALGIGEKQKSYVDSEVIKDSKLTVHYVDVGQGDATFIFLPDGTNMLIDAGTEEASEQLVSYIKSLGVRQINYFVVTHSDADHTGGAEEILTNFEVKTIYRPFQIAVNKDGTPIEKEDLSEYYILNSEKCNPVSTSTYVEFINCVYNETYNENGQTKKAEVIVSYDGIKIEPIFGEEEFLIEFFAPFKTSMTPFDCDYTKGYPVDTYNNTISSIFYNLLLLFF